jgi:RNA polymerase sigma-70 factor (ECF subfamily)
VNVARRRLRRRRLASRFFFDRPPPYLEVASGEASPEERLLIARVYSALDRVPVDERVAWSLRHLAGERLDEVAVLCGCSLATVKRRIASAHEALKEAIDG